MVAEVAVALGVGSVAIWQDGALKCQDGNRYVSGKPQPTPFARRFCGWIPYILAPLTWIAFLLLCVSFGSWKSALLFATLPGAVFCITHPTTVDLPAMAAATGSSLALHAGHPWVALLVALFGGWIHERAPLFAALYAWHPLPLLGLAAVGWWRKAAAPKRPVPVGAHNLHDWLVGHSFTGALKAHKPFQDLLAWKPLLISLRGLPFLAAYFGVTPAAWLAMGVAFASRVMGTDTGRFMLWSAPAVLMALPNDIPTWMVMAHCLTFMRQV